MVVKPDNSCDPLQALATIFRNPADVPRKNHALIYPLAPSKTYEGMDNAFIAQVVLAIERESHPQGEIG
jgi:hypothetical protein